MSHFSVLVVGSNIKSQLKKYDENLKYPKYCKGEVSLEYLKDCFNYYSKEEYSYNKLKEIYSKFGKDWNNNQWKFENEKVFEYSTYNPLSKWDWYEKGGRFANKLLLHSGKYVNSALKKDINFEGINNNLKNYYTDCWESCQNILKKYSNFKHYITFLDNNNEQEYHKQEAVKEFKELNFSFFDCLDNYDVSLETFLEDKSNFSTFAFVKNGEWFEKGKMGWWCHVTNESNDWNKTFKELLDSVNDDELLTIIDCHI